MTTSSSALVYAAVPATACPIGHAEVARYTAAWIQTAFEAVVSGYVTTASRSQPNSGRDESLEPLAEPLPPGSCARPTPVREHHFRPSRPFRLPLSTIGRPRDEFPPPG